MRTAFRHSRWSTKPKLKGFAPAIAADTPLRVKQGTFATGTGTTTVTVDDIGFHPTAVIVFSAGRSGAGDGGADFQISCGFSAAGGDYGVSAFSEDAVATNSNTARGKHTTSSVVSVDAAGWIGEAQLDLTADGFDVTISNAFGTDVDFHYIALAGSVSEAAVGEFNSPASTGVTSGLVSGLSFQPKAVLLLSCNIPNAGTQLDALTCNFMLGCATGSAAGENWVTACGSRDNAATSVTSRYGYSGECIGALSGNAAFVGMRATLSSFEADGFELDFLETNAGFRIVYLALGGDAEFLAGDFLSRTDATQTTVPTTGVNPKALLLASHNTAESANDTIDANASLSIGAARSASERAAIAVTDQNGLGTTESWTASYDSVAYARGDFADALDGTLDIAELGSGSGQFEFVMDNADPDAAFVAFLSIGDPVTVAAVGPALETDVAFALTPLKSLAAGLATEFDTPGENLIAQNPGFDAGTGWFLGTGWSIANGLLTGTNATGDASQTISIVAGRRYLMAYTIKNYVSGSVRFHLGPVLGTIRSGNGTYYEVLTAAATGSFDARFDGTNGDDFNGDIDDARVILQVTPIKSLALALATEIDRADQSIAFDTFTDANSTALSSHTADSGEAWVYFGTPTIEITGNRVRGVSTSDGNRAGLDLAIGTDVTVEAAITIVGSVGTSVFAGVAARKATASAATDYVEFTYDEFLDAWLIQTTTAGDLQVSASRPASGTLMRLVMRGSVAEGWTSTDGGATWGLIGRLEGLTGVDLTGDYVGITVGNFSGSPSSYAEIDNFRAYSGGPVRSLKSLAAGLASEVDVSAWGNTEYITDGGFDDPGTWQEFTGWTANGVAQGVSVASGDYIRQSAGTPLVPGRRYYVTFEVVNYTSGGVRAWLGGGTGVGTTRNAVGVYSEVIVAGSDGWRGLQSFDGASAFTGDCDNLSIQDIGVVPLKSLAAGLATEQDLPFAATWARLLAAGLASEQDLALALASLKALAVGLASEVDLTSIGPDMVVNGGFDTDTVWQKQTGWVISGGVATATATQAGIYQTPSPALVQGRSYRVTFEVVSVSASGVRPQIGGTDGTLRSSPGIYTETIIAGASPDVVFQSWTDPAFTGSIDNVIVEPVGVIPIKSLAAGLATEQDLSLATSSLKEFSAGLSTEQDLAFVVAAVGGVLVGLSTEQDLSFSMTSLKELAAGLSTEQDLSLAATSAKALAAGLSTEQDLSLALAALKLLTNGLATEQDLAFVVAAVGGVLVGLASEQDLGFAVGGLKEFEAGLAAEQDLSLAMSISKVSGTGLATEQDLSTAMASAKQLSAVLATEQDVAFIVSTSSATQTGLATEQDLAFSSTPQRAVAVSLTTEQDLALALTTAKALLAGLATEDDSALASAFERLLAAGLATETDLAFTASVLESVLVGLATETDDALTASVVQAGVVGLAYEQDLALASVVERGYVAGLPTEQDLATPVTHVEFVAIGVPIETDVAPATTHTRGVSFGQSLEVDLALAIVRAKVRAAVLAIETDVAFAVPAVKGIPRPDIIEFSLSVSMTLARALGVTRLEQAILSVNRKRDAGLTVTTSKNYDTEI